MGYKALSKNSNVYKFIEENKEKIGKLCEYVYDENQRLGGYVYSRRNYGSGRLNFKENGPIGKYVDRMGRFLKTCEIIGINYFENEKNRRALKHYYKHLIKNVRDTFVNYIPEGVQEFGYEFPCVNEDFVEYENENFGVTDEDYKSFEERDWDKGVFGKYRYALMARGLFLKAKRNMEREEARKLFKEFEKGLKEWIIKNTDDGCKVECGLMEKPEHWYGTKVKKVI